MIKVKFARLCDLVDQLRSGKLIIVGEYLDTIGVMQLPAILPLTMLVYGESNLDMSSSGVMIFESIIGPLAARVEFPINTKAGHTWIAACSFQANLTVPGAHRVKISTGGESYEIRIDVQSQSQILAPTDIDRRTIGGLQ